jgi:anti-sigma factor RsiW
MTNISRLSSLEAYLDQALPAAEQARWAAHLQSCADCQAQMAAELAFIDQIRQALRAPSYTP